MCPANQTPPFFLATKYVRCYFVSYYGICLALDNSKTAKLDASSAAKVAQSGKQLELNATAGSLFFNVPVALKSGESMNIRTSTMVTGIRGTSG